MKSILKEGKGFYHDIWEIMDEETSKYMKPRNQMVNMAGPAGSERKSGMLIWGQPGQSTWFAELAPTQLQKDGTAMYGRLTIECKPAMAEQLWSKLSSKFLSNMKPGDPTPGYDARTWVVSIDSVMRAAGMINYLATTLKESVRLKEGYAWEREPGKPLPNMKTVQAKYEKSLKEQGPDSMDPVLGDPGKQVNVNPANPEVYDINGDLLLDVPADLNKNLRVQNYREVSVTPKYYFQTKNMGETSYVKYDVKTGQLVDNNSGEKLVTLNPEMPARQVYLWLRRNHMGKADTRFKREGMADNDQNLSMEAKRNRNIDMNIVEALAHFGFTVNEAIALKLMMRPIIDLKRVKSLYENTKLPEKAATRNVAAYIGTDAVLVETYDADKQEAYIEVYHMYKDGKLDKKTFYSFMGILEPHEREELIGYIKTHKDSEMMEEAEKKEKAKKYPRWQDNDGDGKWYEAGDDVSEGEDVPDLGRLNMSGNLDESKFWGRTKGNLNGHDYILRETFRK